MKLNQFQHRLTGQYGHHQGMKAHNALPMKRVVLDGADNRNVILMTILTKRQTFVTGRFAWKNEWAEKADHIVEYHWECG